MYPCAYVFLENKSADTYEHMFKLIGQKSSHKINPSVIMSDFENGLIAATKKCFPNARHVVIYLKFIYLYIYIYIYYIKKNLNFIEKQLYIRK